MINFAWWNLQNLFDTTDDPISRDFEYTPDMGWTDDVFEVKMTALAQAIQELNALRPLSLFACCEIEKDSLLTDLLQRAGVNLQVVEDPTGTSDLRGIDTALAFDPAVLELEFQHTHVVNLRYATRDLFEVGFRVISTGEPLVVIASHWPSRSRGKYRSDPLRIAVAEQIAYLVQRHVKLDSIEYETARDNNDIDAVREKWETPVLILGDFNDHPSDRSVVEHLRASSEIDRVKGRTNDIDGFKAQTADYRAEEVFLFNPMWRFLAEEEVGTYFIDRTRNEEFPNRYQILDQIVVSRGLLKNDGMRLLPDSVDIVRTSTFATSSGRPRRFKFKRPKKPGGPIPQRAPSGLSDHLPVIGSLEL